MKTYSAIEINYMANRARQSFYHPVTNDVLISVGRKEMLFKYDKSTNTYK